MVCTASGYKFPDGILKDFGHTIRELPDSEVETVAEVLGLTKFTWLGKEVMRCPTVS